MYERVCTPVVIEFTQFLHVCYWIAGFALVMEAFMSSFYHICPGDNNFQFGRWSRSCNESYTHTENEHVFLVDDMLHVQNCNMLKALNLIGSLLILLTSIVYYLVDTAFMFIIGGLLIVKMLQARHPDIQANAFVAFFCFAIVIFLTFIGIVSTKPWNTISTQL